MPRHPFHAHYGKFFAFSKKQAGVLLGADCIVGDAYSVRIDRIDGLRKAIIINKFGEDIAYLDDESSSMLALWKAEGLQLEASLSFIAYTQTPDPGFYWGECLILAHQKGDLLIEGFITRIRQQLKKGIRYQLNLNDQSIELLDKNPDSWLPQEKHVLPPKVQGSVILKSRQKWSEQIIEMGRDKNKGCFVLSWIFLLALVTIVVVILKNLRVF